MRKPIIGGNWKMNKTVSEAVKTAQDLKLKIGKFKSVEVVVFPPFTALEGVSKVLKGTEITLGAQNMFWEEEGAYTGEVSPLMLLDVGCKYVILGHSERRGYFGERDEEINKKLKVALNHGLVPLVCMGEKLRMRREGKAKQVVENQLRGCLCGISAQDIEKIVIAYEPVWAIGTGETATSEQAQDMHCFIREILGEWFGEKVAQAIRIQYGGSVKPENIKDLMNKEDIDGALVGGASLKAKSFTQIVRYGESQ